MFAAKTRINLVTGLFQQPSATLGGENLDEKPPGIDWVRQLPSHRLAAPITCFTDGHIKKALYSDKINLAWLIEPRALHGSGEYVGVSYLRDHFRMIFTHDRELLNTEDKARYVPFGGSWLRDWGIHAKTNLVSLLTSPKQQTLGHQLRHRVANQFRDRIEIFGVPYTEYLPSKAPALRPYRYSIIIENVKTDYWFTEKLIDCFSQGTVPIYWGSNLEPFFNTAGVITFDTLDDLDRILPILGEADYISRLPDIRENLKKARQYRCAEYHIAKHLQAESITV